MFSLQPKKKIPFWKEIDFYKEHWSFIIFLPAFLGGFIQLSRLYLLDPSFIRFFSAQQVIPDGLFIIFIISLSLITFLVFNRFFSTKEKIEIGWNLKNIHNNIKNKLYPSFILLLMCGYLYFIDLFLKKEIPLFISIMQFICEILSTIYLSEVAFIILSLYAFKNINLKSPSLEKDKKQAVENFMSSNIWYIFLAIIIFPTFLLLSLHFSSSFLKFYTQVNKLPKTVNERIYLNKVKANLNIHNSLDIEYYNGNYIFIKVNNNDNQYLILKGESFINLIDKDEK